MITLMEIEMSEKWKIVFAIFDMAKKCVFIGKMHHESKSCYCRWIIIND